MVQAWERKSNHYRKSTKLRLESSPLPLLQDKSFNFLREAKSDKKTTTTTTKKTKKPFTLRQLMKKVKTTDKKELNKTLYPVGSVGMLTGPKPVEVYYL